MQQFAIYRGFRFNEIPQKMEKESLMEETGGGNVRKVITKVSLIE